MDGKARLTLIIMVLLRKPIKCDMTYTVWSILSLIKFIAFACLEDFYSNQLFFQVKERGGISEQI